MIPNRFLEILSDFFSEWSPKIVTNAYGIYNLKAEASFIADGPVGGKALFRLSSDLHRDNPP